jgi:hypothetical protein
MKRALLAFGVLLAGTATPALGQRYYRAPTAEEATRIEFESFFTNIYLDRETADRARAVIRRYENDRRSMRPTEERIKIVGDSLKAARDSTLRSLLKNRSDSATFELNLLRRRR